jgi:hypothetical protein
MFDPLAAQARGEGDPLHSVDDDARVSVGPSIGIGAVHRLIGGAQLLALIHQRRAMLTPLDEIFQAIHDRTRCGGPNSASK